MDTSILLPRWNLDNLQNGLDIEKFENQLSSIKEKMIELEEDSKVAALKPSELLTLSQMIKQIESAESFYYCLTTEEVEPFQLTSIIGSISKLKSHVYIAISNLEQLLVTMNEAQLSEWKKSIEEPNFLQELEVEKEGPSKQEKVISTFARETLSGLEDLYIQVRNHIKVRIEPDKEASFAEAMKMAFSHPEQSKRTHAFKELNNTLESQSNIFASIYNQMTGIRLNENKVKEVDYLDGSLKSNGISKTTLDAMWTAVDSNIQELSNWVKKKEKAETDQNSWHELMTSSPKGSFSITFSQAVDEITTSLAAIDPDMSEFVKAAISKGWVDAEPRTSKSPGGFCAPFIQEGESRISLSYDNSLDSARRLAHELGHAWHYKQMDTSSSLRFLDDALEMTMAESSSIFFETVFIDHVIRNAKEAAAKKEILRSKIELSLNYLMSIRGAFLFENEFYELRKKGQLNAKQIEGLSLKSQKKAFGSTLRDYDPFVWIKYVQFYQANVPFYNYPYSFGYLLSIGLLELAKEEEHFDRKFQKLLSGTGKLPLEQLFKEHFHIDLSQPHFWERAMQNIIRDIEQYNHLQ
ncbi:peptidase M3 [Planococcus sp. N028]|uniref:Peptidase M3 n=1 Tax=Planococcus shixiaomingii TaxID=3058393 RepID=A0ABT8MY60_9BACL|nr:M3 family metallopeptidase [Planococcus sp. N028]MDN7240564.1 peptidase M3 [Planococcus sp. N028]